MVRFFLQRSDCEHKHMLYNLLASLNIQGLVDKFWQLICNVVKETLIIEKELCITRLYGGLLETVFLLKMFTRVFRYKMIVKNIRLWKLLSHKLTYKVISTANILHTYLSLLTLYLHSQTIYHQLTDMVLCINKYQVKSK